MARHARPIAALFGLVVAGACSTFDNEPARLCIWQGNRVQGEGRCPTRCEWQCSTAERLGCGATDCVTACEASASDDATCEERALLYWGCMAASRQTEATCCENRIDFHVPDGLCNDEQNQAAVACNGPPLAIEWVRDAGTVVDASPPSSIGKVTAFAATTDAGVPSLVGGRADYATQGDGGRWAASCDPDGGLTTR